MPAAKQTLALRTKLAKDAAPELVPSAPFGPACWGRLEQVARADTNLAVSADITRADSPHAACGAPTPCVCSSYTARVRGPIKPAVRRALLPPRFAGSKPTRVAVAAFAGTGL